MVMTCVILHNIIVPIQIGAKQEERNNFFKFSEVDDDNKV